MSQLNIRYLDACWEGAAAIVADVHHIPHCTLLLTTHNREKRQVHRE